MEFEEKGFEQIQKTAAMVLNSKDAPDLMEYNKGNATAGLLAKQGLLTDLTAEVTKRGWDKLLGPSVRTTAKYDAKGVMGSGKLVRRPELRRVHDGVLQQGHVRASTASRCPRRSTSSTAAHGHASSRPRASPRWPTRGAEYPAQQYLYQLALSKADRSWVDNYQLLQGQGGLPRRRLDVRRRRPSPTG